MRKKETILREKRPGSIQHVDELGQFNRIFCLFPQVQIVPVQRPSQGCCEVQSKKVACHNL